MTDLNKLLMDYMIAGGKYPATYLRGYSDRGRFGVRGEGVGIPAVEADAYESGGRAAQADRATFPSAAT